MLIRMRLHELSEEEREEVDQVDIDRLVREILNAPPPTREQLDDIESELRRRHRRGEE